MHSFNAQQIEIKVLVLEGMVAGGSCQMVVDTGAIVIHWTRIVAKKYIESTKTIVIIAPITVIVNITNVDYYLT